MELKGYSINQTCGLYIDDDTIEGIGNIRISVPGKSWLENLPCKIQYKGPMLIRYKNCTQFIFNEPRISGYIIISLVFLILLLLSFIIIYRIIHLLNMSYHARVRTRLNSNGMVFDTINGTKYISYIRLTLYVLLCRSPFADSCVKLSEQHGSKLLSPGDFICTTNGSILFNSFKSIHPLIHDYDFSDFKMDRNGEWGCASGSCPSVESCASLHNVVEVGNNTISKTFCYEYPSACVFGRGCWFGKVKITGKNLMSLYKVGLGVAYPVLEDKNSDCSLSTASHFITIPNSPNIIEKDKHWFLCPHASIRNSPNKYLIGSYQRIGDSASFDWSAIDCDVSWYSNQSCKIIRGQSLKDCYKLPYSAGGLYYKINNNNELKVEYSSGSFLTSYNCNSKILSHDEQCFDISVSIHGHRHSGSGIDIIAKANSKSSTSSHKMLLNCSEDVFINIPCNNHKHYYPMSEAITCYGVHDESLSDDLEISYEDTITKLTNYSLDIGSNNFHILSISIIIVISLILMLLLKLILGRC